jgi:hypothetical protein
VVALPEEPVVDLAEDETVRDLPDIIRQSAHERIDAVVQAKAQSAIRSGRGPVGSKCIASGLAVKQVDSFA